MTISFINPSGIGVLPTPHSHQNAAQGGQLDHGLAMTAASLLDDDHSIYAKLAGRSGGQTLIGGTGVADILKLQGTAGNGTLTSPAIQFLVGNNGATIAATILNNGNILLGLNSIFDRVNERLGINTTTPSQRVDVAGNTQIRGWLNVTDGIANCIFASVNVDGYCYFVTTTNHGMAFGTNNSWTRMILSTDGKLGIGMSPTYTLDVTGNLRCSTGFGCNGATPQTAYASGGALSGYVAGTKGFDTDAHAQEIHTLLTNIRAALVANGIMS